MAHKSMVIETVKTFGDWGSAHIVIKGETFGLCGIAPVPFWDDVRDYNKPICRHCMKQKDIRSEDKSKITH